MVGLHHAGGLDHPVAGQTPLTVAPAQAWRVGQGGIQVIVLGIVLLIIGFIAHVPILWTLGVVVLVIGAILFLLGSAGHALGGRRHYW